MKFMKFGKALLMSAVTTGVVLSTTSCIQSYTTGFLYVTETQAGTASDANNGVISGYKIDHNTGKLTLIHGLPVSTQGSNPQRAVLITGGRYVYVLNMGKTATGGSNCTTADPCSGSIAEFTVGSGGVLTYQNSYYPKGLNSYRLQADSSGNFLYVLDHDSIGADGTNPSSASNPNTNCALALGSGVNACGDVTVFKIASSTGRLSYVEDSQVSSASGNTVAYFPIPANAVDMVLAGNNLTTLVAPASVTQSFPYTGGSLIFPYAIDTGNGQLTITQNTTQTLTDSSTSGVPNGVGLSYAGGYLWLLDNNAITANSVTSPSQIIGYNVSTTGTLTTIVGGATPNGDSHAFPIAIIAEKLKGWLYLASRGDVTATSSSANTTSGLYGYVQDSTTKQLSTLPGAPFTNGVGPVCLVEDPSDQFLYTANANDVTVTGHTIAPQSGLLKDLPRQSTYTLDATPTYCFADSYTE